MHPTEVIELYVDDTVRLLPSRQRADVGAELRSLLNEHLQAKAQELGRPADEAMALALLREYGRPTEVAARYQPAWTIIDPADSRNFMRASFIGVCALLLLSGLRKLRPEVPGTTEDWVKIAVLAWLGLLVVVFGTKGWAWRHWPSMGLWKPRDRDRSNRIGTAVVIPVASCCVALYAAPAWVLDQISGGRIDTSWAAYTERFEELRLPGFIVLLSGSLVLLAYVAIQGRWSRLTRRISLAINLALACLCLSFALEGGIFESEQVDQTARDVLALVAVIYLPFVGVQLYGELGRVDRPALSKERSFVNG